MANFVEVSFRACLPGESPGRELLSAMVAELGVMYGIQPGVHIGVPLEPTEMAPPTGTYLVGYIGAEAVAGAGLRTISPGIAEIKRMYVAPAWRGRGLARRLLAALEEAALELGLHTVRLDTGAKQPDARHLYESAGYRQIPDYNENPRAAFWGEKRLTAR